MNDDSQYNQAIKVKLLLFGSIAEIFGRKNLEVAVEFGTTINLDGQIIEDLETQLNDLSEVALMPPFSGG